MLPHEPSIDDHQVQVPAQETFHDANEAPAAVPAAPEAQPAAAVEELEVPKMSVEEFPIDGVSQEEVDKVCKMKALLKTELEALTKELNSDMTSEIRLLRFLRGAKGNPDAAAKNYRNHLGWRKTNGMDEKRREILDKMFAPQDIPLHSAVVHHFPYNNLLRKADGMPLTDKEGNVITVQRIGQVDVAGLLGEVHPEDVVKWYLYNIEMRALWIERLSRDTRKLVRCTMIKDMQGLSKSCLSPQALNLLRKLAQHSANNYPETVSRIFVVNAPWLFHRLWKTIGSWMPKETQSKLQILGGDYDKALLEHIEAPALPPCLGGACDSKLAELPETGKAKNDRFALGPKFQTIQIGARSRQQLPYQVVENTQVHWAWGVDTHDIGFSVTLRTQKAEGGTEEREIVKYTKHNSVRSVRGALMAEKDGVLTFVWDNGYSIFTAKTVKFKIDCIRPVDEQEADKEIAHNLQQESDSPTHTHTSPQA